MRAQNISNVRKMFVAMGRRVNQTLEYNLKKCQGTNYNDILYLYNRQIYNVFLPIQVLCRSLMFGLIFKFMSSS